MNLKLHYQISPMYTTFESILEPFEVQTGRLPDIVLTSDAMMARHFTESVAVSKGRDAKYHGQYADDGK